MADRKADTAQRDFSAGEIDVDLKRADDHPVLKAGVRQAINVRILNSRSLRTRPGRKALFMPTSVSRTEEITMQDGTVFFISFLNSICQIRDSVGTQVFFSASFSWTSADFARINYAVLGNNIVICFTGQIPKVITWDGASTWSLADYAEQITAGGQKRTFFYRISKHGVTMQPSAVSGAITIDFSDTVCSPQMVGTRMRYIGRQILITGFNTNQQLTGQVQEILPYSQTAVVGSDPRNVFSLGDEVIGSVSGARGIVTGLSDATHMQIQLISTTDSTTIVTAGLIGQQANAPQFISGYVSTDKITGPSGAVQASAVTGAQPPQPVIIWDEEVMNGAFRGFPASCFVDQNRLGFCDFPGVPSGIGWSAIGTPTDLYVGGTPNAAIFEVAPESVRVRYVVPGPESSEFVFCDRKVYYIPITPSNPLKPGSVAFMLLSSNGCEAVIPRAIEGQIVYVASGGVSINVITAPGYYGRPFQTSELTEFHSHLINSPVAIAIPTGSNQFPERYVYVLNSDDNIVVGKYAVEDGKIKGMVGWTRHIVAGANTWVAALNSSVIFAARYVVGAAPEVFVVERLDATLYLDAAIFVNNLPVAFTPPPGKGPLWWIPNGSVTLIDNGYRFMGIYQIDADGFIVPQGLGGENLASSLLVAGQAYDTIAEPFIPPVQPGEDVSQRMWARRIVRAQVYVANSTGFLMERLYSGQTGPNLPAPGTVMKIRRIPMWNVNEDATALPPLREQSYLDRPIGRSHDPRWAIVKDQPGPLDLIEIATQVSV